MFGGLLKRPQLWHLNKRSVATAVAIGLFCAFVPVPFQMLLAAGGAIAMRANLPIAVVLVWVSNPLTIPPLAYFCYQIGRTVLQPFQTVVPDEISAGSVWESLPAILGPLWLGGLLAGAAAAGLGYALVRLAWRLHVGRDWQRRGTRQRNGDVQPPAAAPHEERF